MADPPESTDARMEATAELALRRLCRCAAALLATDGWAQQAALNRLPAHRRQLGKQLEAIQQLLNDGPAALPFRRITRQDDD